MGALIPVVVVVMVLADACPLGTELRPAAYLHHPPKRHVLQGVTDELWWMSLKRSIFPR